MKTSKDRYLKFTVTANYCYHLLWLLTSDLCKVSAWQGLAR
jgi:hypothetical protein